MLEQTKESWKRVPYWIKITIAIFALVSGLSGTVAALDSVKLRPVVNGELETVGVRVAGLELERLDDKVSRAQQQLYEVEKEQLKEPSVRTNTRINQLQNIIERLKRRIKRKEKEIK